MLKRITMTTIALAASAALAQTGTTMGTTGTMGTTTTTRTANPPAAVLNDGEIAKVLLTVNDGEIDAAKLAKRKAKNKEVEHFADMMVDAHKENMKDTKKIAKAEKLDTKKTDLSRSIAEEGKTTKKDLKKSARNDFDKNYIHSQVMMHEKALSLITDTLIPNAKSPTLKDHLERTRTAVEHHLAEARDLDSKIQ